MIGALLGGLTLLIWLGLIFAHGQFWRARVTDRGMPPPPRQWPSVAAIVPARNEADVIARSIGSLLEQDYPGEFRVILVDDNSSDGTADAARGLNDARLTILSGAPLPAGWTGKLWALSQGIAAAERPEFLWLTDADIEHASDTLRALVSRAEDGGLQLVSLMARLHCATWAERMLVPAFVFFFQMLYPFDRVNRPKGIGGAAGGCMLVRRTALERAGGIGAIRNALIDDCTFGALIKRHGRIWLGLTDRSRSIRPYRDIGSIMAMISRSAYAQLGYSPLTLIGTLLGLFLVFGAPPLLALTGSGAGRIMAAMAWALMALSFQPMLRFYHRSPLYGVALPLIAAFYAGCTLLSAWQHHRGRGGMWKGRAQAAMRPS
jgi:hopene-associated glycosyltransferase HpnB